MKKLLISNGVKKIPSIILILFYSILLLYPLLPQKVYAQVCPSGFVNCARDCDDPTTYWNDTQPCQLCNLFYMFEKIINFVLFTIVPLAAVLMLVVGGALFIFSAGSPSNVTRAKSIITATVIGLIIVYASWLIINTFFIAIGVADWTGLTTGWFRIDCPITP
jgi:hypothetical protein